MSEYARFLEGSSRDLARARTPAERLHLDIFLIAPMLAIMVMGLFVLFSASDSDWDTVNRQIRNFVIGYGVFLVAAQVRPDTLQRWAPRCTSVPCFCYFSFLLSEWVARRTALA